MTQWLVRTAKNVISGPFNKEVLCQMVLSGELGSQDEVCESGNYWIYLHEREEVSRQLGINLPKPPKGEDDETTETQTQTQTQTEVTEKLAMSVAATRDGQPSAAAVAAEEERELATDVTTMARKAETPLPAADHSGNLNPQARPLESAEPAGAAPNGATGATGAGATPAAASSGPRVVYRPMVLGEIERPSAWRMAIWILVLAAFFLATWMLRALRH